MVLRVIRFCAVLGLGLLTVQTPAFGSSERTAAQKSQTKFMIETLSESPMLMLLGLASNGASNETLRILKTELDKSSFPKVEIKKDELFFGGRPTQIQIAGYSPLSIRYRGQNWSFDKSKTADANYFNLKKFLSPQKFSALAIILDEARAQSSTEDEVKPNHRTPEMGRNAGAIIGGTFGIYAGALISLLCVSTPIAVIAVPAGLIGAGIGAYGTYKYEKNREDREKALVGQLVKGNFTLLCDDKNVELVSAAAFSQSGFKFQHENFDQTVKVFDEKGTPLRPELIGDEQKQFLKTFENCKSDKDAAKIKQQLQAAAGQVQQVLAANASAPAASGAKTAPVVK